VFIFLEIVQFPIVLNALSSTALTLGNNEALEALNLINTR
jgi:hypothetical protein